VYSIREQINDFIIEKVMWWQSLILKTYICSIEIDEKR
jgi:hypothetical protein